LGVILYEMATGRVPFKAETPIAVLVKHMTDPLSPPRIVNPNLPEAVEKVILKAMAKNPDNRFATAGDMVEALSAAMRNAPPPAMPVDDKTIAEQPEPTLMDKPAETSPRRVSPFAWLFGAAGIGVAIVLMFACGIAFFLFSRSADAPPTLQAEAGQIVAVSPTPGIGIAPPTEPAAATEPTEAAATLPPAGENRRPTATPGTAAPTNTPYVQPTATSAPVRGPASVALTFGEEGIGPGMFTDARSIAIDNNTGYIYVGEYIGGRIQVFDETGKFLKQWSVDPEMPLRGMDVDRSGNVYAVQRGRIYKYNGETGELVGEIEYATGQDFDDVVVAADGGLVTAWYGGDDDIVRFNGAGQPVLTIPAAVSGQTNASELDTRVAVDGLGNIYALGTFNSAVLKFGPDGKFLDKFGSGGDGPGALDSPMAIAVDGQARIYVSELVGPIKILAQIARSELAPPDARALARVLTRVIHGERDPVALAAELSPAHAEILWETLDQIEVPLPAEAESARQAFSFEELIEKVAEACSGEVMLWQRLWDFTEELSTDERLPADVRALGTVLRKILAGERQKHVLAELSPTHRSAVEQLLDWLAQ
jgi:hypothetical protein